MHCEQPWDILFLSAEQKYQLRDSVHLHGLFRTVRAAHGMHNWTLACPGDNLHFMLLMVAPRMEIMIGPLHVQGTICTLCS